MTLRSTYRGVFSRLSILMLCLVAALLLNTMYVTPAFADANQQSSDPCKKESKDSAGNNEVCTNFACLKQKALESTNNNGNGEAGDGQTGQDNNKKEPGILTNISNTIKDIVNDASKKLFTAFTDSPKYKGAVKAAVALVIIFYGIGFMTGITGQPSFGQALNKLIKIGIVFTIISPTGWTFFNDIVVKFFNDGTDDLIRTVISIGSGIESKPGDSPFVQLDGLATWILSPDMLIAMMSVTFASGPYGLAVGGLMTFAIGGVIKLLIEALKVYGMSFIMRSLLLGIAPIFIVFLLFDRTKQLFVGWLNSLINLSLQPILYFTFISFFFVMILTAATDMLTAKSSSGSQSGNQAQTGTDNSSNSSGKQTIEFCWTEGQSISGSQNKMSFWRVKFPGENAGTADTFDWRGPLSCMLGNEKDKDKCKKEFPINIIDILSFLILVYVAQNFGMVINRLASDISSAFVNLDTQSKLDMGQHGAAAATKGPVTQAANAPRGTGASGGKW